MGTEIKRKMASVERVIEVVPIPGADSIEVFRVLGWQVVGRKNEFAVGDLVVYIAIDAWVPHELAPFLSKGQEPKEYNGVLGSKLRTVKLRGALSQGLLLPINFIGQQYHVEGTDPSELLNIQKYDPPLPAQLAGEAIGLFPSFIQKTDQERIQNLVEDFDELKELDWEITEKLDGSSMTVFANQDDYGVCSRNLNLRETDGNTFWMVARRDRLIEKISSTGRNLAFQGELIGPGIQGNPYKLGLHEFYLFDIFDIDNYSYLSPEERKEMADQLGINMVPVLDETRTQETIEGVLKFAEDKSRINPKAEREGVVFKSVDGKISFKAISNKFLLKTA